MSDNIRRVVVESVTNTLSPPFSYRSEDFGFLPLKETGKNVKICILDSGIPNHSGIKNIKSSVNFTKHSDEDTIGHATMMAGILSANDSNLTGMVCDSELYCAKIVDDTCRAQFNSIVAGILWGVIKEVDIIFIPLSTTIEHVSLSSAINKAIKSNICVIASVGNEKILEYPARYNNVISVGSLDNNKKLASFSTKGKINVNGTFLDTTYKENSYANISGTSASAAVVTGIAAKIIDNFKYNKIPYTPNSVLAKIKQIRK